MSGVECPQCGLFNPDSAEECDCGFVFGVDTPRRLPRTKAKWTVAVTAGSVFCAVGTFGLMSTLKIEVANFVIGGLAIGTGLAVIGTALSASEPRQDVLLFLNGMMTLLYAFLWIGGVTHMGVL